MYTHLLLLYDSLQNLEIKFDALLFIIQPLLYKFIALKLENGRQYALPKIILFSRKY